MRMSRLLVWFQTPKVRTGSVETIGVSLRSTSNMSVLIEVHWQPLLGVHGSK